MTVIGYRKTGFDTKNSKHIDGYNIYCPYPLDKGEGEGAERLFMTVDKLLGCQANRRDRLNGIIL